MPAQTGSKPLPGPVYAVAGVGDLLAEQVRRLVANAPEIQAQFQRNAAEFPDELRTLGRELPRDLRAFAADLPSYAADLQSKARDIDGETVRRNLETAQTKAQDLYRTLVQRGEQAMNQPTPDATEPSATPPPADGGAPTQS
jgi:predicted phage gp36 major capsid-like protein